MCTDTSDDLLVTATVPVLGPSGRATPGAVERRKISPSVAEHGAGVTPAHTVKISPSHALQVSNTLAI